MNRLATAPVLLLLLAVASGCPREKFEIVMERTPEGELRRTITVWTEDSGATTVPPAEDSGSTADASAVSDPVPEPAVADDSGTNGKDEVLVAIYGRPKRLPGGKRRFSGVFVRDLPADIVHEEQRNFAALGIRRSMMGESVTYVERMPGRSRMVEVARAAYETADIIIKALFGYAAEHPALQNEPDRLKKLKAFLEGEFRDDLLNIGLLLWLEAASDEDDPVVRKRAIYRVSTYLAENGYIEPVMLGESEGFREAITQGALRKIATCLGHDPNKTLPPYLAELVDPSRLEEALEVGLAAMDMTTDDVRKKAELVLGDILGGGPKGTVLWKCRVAPVETNGSWDDEAQGVQWHARSLSGYRLPQILYARWANPDVKFQQEHFGKVVLSDDLPAYNSWCDGLAADHRAHWKALLTSLQPGPELKTKLTNFRFPAPKVKDASGTRDAGTPEGGEEDAGLAEGATLILEGLTQGPN